MSSCIQRCQRSFAVHLLAAIYLIFTAALTDAVPFTTNSHSTASQRHPSRLSLLPLSSHTILSTLSRVQSKSVDDSPKQIPPENKQTKPPPTHVNASHPTTPPQKPQTENSKSPSKSTADSNNSAQDPKKPQPEPNSPSTQPHREGNSSSQNPKSNANATENGADDDEGDPQQPLPTEEGKPGKSMSASEMIAHARSQSAGLMKGGFIEFIEWLFVFILVAPGTFPAIGCVILSCTSFWRRRLSAASSTTNNSNANVGARSGTNSAATYQRVPLTDHGALTARARMKASDDRDMEAL